MPCVELLYCVNERPTLLPVVSQINSVYIVTARLIKEYFKVILLLQPHLPRNLFPQFSDLRCACISHLLHAAFATDLTPFLFEHLKDTSCVMKIVFSHPSLNSCLVFQTFSTDIRTICSRNVNVTCR